MKSRYISNLAFIDLLFNLILGFVFLFLVAFLLINKPEKTADVEKKAEFMITMFWQDEHEGDIDLWVETPHGVVNYINPTLGAVHLDKDDLGLRNDWYYDTKGVKRHILINREIVTFRALQAGKYIVNAHYYSNEPINTPQQGPARVTVEITRLNPFFIHHTSTHELTTQGDEKTFIRFTMTPNGIIKDENFLPKSLVTIKRKEGILNSAPTVPSGGF